MKWLLPIALAAFVVYMVRRVDLAVYDPTYYAEDPEELPDLIEEAATMAEEFASAVTGGPVDHFRTSEAMKRRLKQREGLRLQRYRLGDGGYTIGYGRYYADGGPACPAAIDLDTAERWFTEDLVARGEKWVKLYVSVPVTQNQFDAMVSMAYNLRPSSFRKIADAVNAGQDPAPVAMQYTRPGTNLERGLIARRNEELSIFYGTETA